MAKNKLPKKKVSVPQFGSYNVLFEYLIKHGLDAEYVVPPEITKRTMELGNRNSPDYVCAPFKFTLGCFLEALEAGADTLLEVGGIVACRLKYYGSLQEQIINQMGYKDITFVNLGKGDPNHPETLLKLLKLINPHPNYLHLAQTGITVVTMLQKLDLIQNYVSKNVGFEIHDGDFDKEFAKFINKLRNCPNNVFAVNKIYNETLENMKAIPIDKPEHPLRVAIIGEYYTVMDDFSSHNIEKKMAKFGVEVDRWLNVSHTLIGYSAPKYRADNTDYVKYDLGVTTTSNIRFALKCAKAGYDGIIHMKSFGCTPEIDSMPVLRNISADYDVPILFFSFDCQNAEAGIETRLEAFYDMINLKQEAKKQEKVKGAVTA